VPSARSNRRALRIPSAVALALLAVHLYCTGVSAEEGDSLKSKVERTGHQASKGASKIVDKTSKALKHAGKKTAAALHKAGTKTGEALNKATKKTKQWVEEKSR
jgi:hypothetical protein